MSTRQSIADNLFLGENPMSFEFLDTCDSNCNNRKFVYYRLHAKCGCIYHWRCAIVSIAHRYHRLFIFLLDIQTHLRVLIASMFRTISSRTSHSNAHCLPKQFSTRATRNILYLFRYGSRLSKYYWRDVFKYWDVCFALLLLHNSTIVLCGHGDTIQSKQSN